MSAAPSPSVLAVLAAGFEEIEAAAPIDLLRRAGATVVVASLHPGVAVTGRNGLLWLAETTLDAVASQSFDALFLPGGPGVAHLRRDPRVLERVRQHVAAKRCVAAICAAPLVLHDAGVLAGRHYTAHPSTAGELRDILAGRDVVEDAPLITSRGAGTAVAFGLALVARLVGNAKATEVRQSICA
jgi:4-methyl-5(b-hydroxyethyl)-thiazole monophosphate biosynthesis